MTKETSFKIRFTTNLGSDDFEEVIDSYDKLLREMGELLEEVHDEFEREYPGNDVVWVNRFWADEKELTSGHEVKTEIYVSGQDAYASLVVSAA